MARRVLQLVALAAAVALAVVAGTAVRHQRSGPDPVEIAREATAAYAAGDCDALRSVSYDPALVECADVAGVSQAYRDEGLRPSTFTYDVVARDGDEASVRITYARDDRPAEEVVRLRRGGDGWKVLAEPLGEGQG